MFWLAEVFNGSYSAEEMRRREEWARRQRAEAVAGLFTGAGRGLARLVAGGVRILGKAAVAAYRGHRRSQRRRAAIRELHGLTDRTLGDIGISRGEIRDIVDGMLDGPREARTAFRVVASEGRQSAPAAGASTRDDESSNDWQRAA